MNHPSGETKKPVPAGPDRVRGSGRQTQKVAALTAASVSLITDGPHPLQRRGGPKATPRTDHYTYAGAKTDAEASVRSVRLVVGTLLDCHNIMVAESAERQRTMVANASCRKGFSRLVRRGYRRKSIQCQKRNRRASSFGLRPLSMPIIPLACP